MPDREWLTIAEACRLLKVSRRTLYTYMESGRLQYYQPGGDGHRRIKAEDLDTLMVASGPADKLTAHAAGNSRAIDGVEELVKCMVEPTIRQLHVAQDAPNPIATSDASSVADTADTHKQAKEGAKSPEKETNQAGWFPFEFDSPFLRS